eukprot:3174972-Rhodomonas_salina.1
MSGTDGGLSRMVLRQAPAATALRAQVEPQLCRSAPESNPFALPGSSAFAVQSVRRRRLAAIDLGGCVRRE